MPEIELQHQASLSHPLAHIEGEEGQSFLTQQLRHGDIYLNPSIFSTFDSSEERSAWIESYKLEEPEYHEHDKQGWTYIADYSMHPDTPYLPADAPTNFFIYAKIDHENKLRFGIFSAHPEKKSTTSSLALAHIKDHKTTPFIHGDQRPALRIASKEEAEAKLLKNGKLIRSALPKFVGVLMDMGKARITLSVSETQIEKNEEGEILSTESLAGDTFYYTKIYYGHIWSYWANIIDNTLYFVGIPICSDNKKGSIAYTKSGQRTSQDGSSSATYSTVREQVALPPTEDDLRSSFSINGLLRSNFYSSPTHPLYAAVQEAFGLEDGSFSTQYLKIENWLESRLDTDTPTTWLSRPLAKISDNKALQLAHGDIAANLTLLGYEGGVYHDAPNSEFIIAESSEVTYTPIENASFFTISSSGHSGFIAARTAYSIDGKTFFNAQCFYANQLGFNYSISTIGGNRPFGMYSDEIRSEDIINLQYHLTSTTIIEDSEGGGGGGGGGGDGGEEPDPDGGGGGGDPIYENGYIGGEGIIVKAVRVSNSGEKYIRWEFDLDHSVYVALAREIEFESKITASVRAMFSGKIANIDVGIASSTATSLGLEFAGTDGDDTSTKTETNTAPLIPDWSGKLELDLISIGSSATALSSGKYVTVEATQAPANTPYDVTNWYKVSLNKAALKAELESNLRQCYQRLSVFDTKIMSSNGETLTATSTGNPLDYTITVS